MDVFDGVGATGIFGESRVIVINQTGFWTEDNVLKDRAKLDGVEDVWLFLFRKTNTLCVALMAVSRDTINNVEIHTPPSMLKTPRSLQQCSSSPINARFGSADSVVLPVPERPKKTVTSPALPSFAEE